MSVKTETPHPIRGEADAVKLTVLEMDWMKYSCLIDLLSTPWSAGRGSKTTQMRPSSKKGAYANEPQQQASVYGNAVESLLNQRAARSPKMHDNAVQRFVRAVRLRRDWVSIHIWQSCFTAKSAQTSGECQMEPRYTKETRDGFIRRCQAEIQRLLRELRALELALAKELRE